MHILDALRQILISSSENLPESIIWWMLAWHAWKCISSRKEEVVIIACGGARLGPAEDQNSPLHEPAVHVRARPCPPPSHTHAQRLFFSGCICSSNPVKKKRVRWFANVLFDVQENKIFHFRIEKTSTNTSRHSMQRLFYCFLWDINRPRHHLCHLFSFTTHRHRLYLSSPPYTHTLPALLYFHSCNASGFFYFPCFCDGRCMC